MTDNRLSFKAMCERFEVTPRTLRYYEYIELLQPEREGRARYYSPREVARMTLIMRGRRFGFSLEEIRQWLEIYEKQGTRAQMEAWIALADRMPANDDLAGVILLLETSEELPTAETVRRWVRALGERGTLSVVGGVMVAAPAASALGTARPDADARAAWRAAQRDAVIEEVSAYNPQAVICVGPPFGHTRPQWILPYGGEVTLDGRNQRLTASYR